MLSHRLQKGQIARSIKGRDKGKFYVIVAWHENEVFVADGCKRTVENPKRKNKIHLWYTSSTCSCESDAAVRQGLACFDQTQD